MTYKPLYAQERALFQRKPRTENPLPLLHKFQANPLALREDEKLALWYFFDEYVARCETTHFGSTDDKGRFQDQRTVRIMALWQMMLELRDAHCESYFCTVKGTSKKVKACKLTAPLRHPNLILTYYRRTFPNLELIIRSRILFGVDLTVNGLTWDVNSTTTNRWSKVAAKFREGQNKSLPLDVYNALAQRCWTLRTQKTWLRACCQYYLWLRYQCRSLSMEVYGDARMSHGGDVDRLAFNEGENVFSE